MRAKAATTVLGELERVGLCLLSDASLPSAAAMIAGEPIRGSWWAHPRAHEIYCAGQLLEDHPDVVVTKLVGRKVTYVHRTLWPALIAAATSGEAWQTRGLSAGARTLHRFVTRSGSLRTDLVSPALTAALRRPGDAARELEARLLVHAEEVHTESGRHAKLLESWQYWSKRVRFRRAPMPVSDAKARLEAALRQLAAPGPLTARLPWQ